MGARRTRVVVLIVTILLAVVNLSLNLLANYASLEMPAFFARYPYMIWTLIAVGLVASVVLTAVPAIQTKRQGFYQDSSVAHARDKEGDSGEVEYQFDVFISYSHKDADWVRQTLLVKLESHAFSVLIDFRDFPTGGLFVDEMQKAVLLSKRVILILTPDYVNSEWAQFENAMAQVLDPSAKQRKIIPVLRKTCDIPLRLRILHYRDLRAEDQSEWELLIRDLI